MRGPQASKKEFEKVLRYIELGKKEGATLFKGGNRLDRKGYFQTYFNIFIIYIIIIICYKQKEKCCFNGDVYDVSWNYGKKHGKFELLVIGKMLNIA